MQSESHSKPVPRQPAYLWSAVALGLIGISAVVWWTCNSADKTGDSREHGQMHSQNMDKETVTATVHTEHQPTTSTTTQIDEISEGGNSEENDRLKQLQNLSDRLSDASNRQSIETIQRRLQSEYGTSPRATKPALVAPKGKFDYATAQLHDVKRSVRDDGEEYYVSVMLDAEGRIMEIELPHDTGEDLYRTMEQIHSNPLIENIYREIAMPLLDKILKDKGN